MADFSMSSQGLSYVLPVDAGVAKSRCQYWFSTRDAAPPEKLVIVNCLRKLTYPGRLETRSL